MGAPSVSLTIALAVGMLAAGSINTIAYKVADWQSAPGVYNAAQCYNESTVEGRPDCTFTHPFFQVYAMFLGECCCLVAFLTLRLAKASSHERHTAMLIC